MSVYLLATLDTKGDEAAFVREQLEAQSVAVTLVDTGCVGEAKTAADVSREALFEFGGTDLATVQARGDRGHAVSVAAKAAVGLVEQAHTNGQLSGVFGLGGSAGTTIGTAAMRALPLGIPKVMVSTLAAGDVQAFVGVRDIVMVNSVVDIAGLNRISRTVLAEAAAAMAGMVNADPIAPSDTDRPIIAATMFGVTTPCVERARKILEGEGYEVIVFHATGTGGQAMESLIEDGLVAGVLDITTTEIADELVGGVLSAGADRLTAAGRQGIPQVVSVGATDMVNFWGLPTVPDAFKQRQLHRHNDNVTLMRTTLAECRDIGQEIVKKLEKAQGPVKVLLPLLGVSAIDREGESFNDPTARDALFSEIHRGLSGEQVVDVEAHINDDEFATKAAETLLAMLRNP